MVIRIKIYKITSQSGNKNKANLQPIILQEIIDAHKQKVRDIVKKESVGPIEHCKIYDKYNFLISKQVKYMTNTNSSTSTLMFNSILCGCLMEISSSFIYNYSKHLFLELSSFNAIFVLQADADVDTFMKESHTFEECAKEVNRYHKLVEEITYSSVKVCSFSLLRIVQIITKTKPGL